jgi:hypothetical protein
VTTKLEEVLERVVSEASMAGEDEIHDELVGAINDLVDYLPNIRPHGLKSLVYKRGEFSKTAVILTVTWAMGLGMWVTQGLFSGSQILGWVMPAFDAGDFGAVVGAASALYFGTHNIRAGGGR